MNTQYKIATIALATFAWASIANANLLFSYDYSGNTPGVGFLDPVDGPARRLALESSGTQFSTLFSSFFTNSATITLAVTSTVDGNAPTLASAGSNTVSAPGTFGAGEVIRGKLIDATDLNGADFDGIVDVNWGYAWELDFNTPAVGPGPGQTFDLYAALFHEYTHALGFGTLISTVGIDSSGMGGQGSGTQGTWGKWDQFLADGANSPLINLGNFEVNQSALSNAQTNGGFFVGPNAVAAYGGNPVPLFANPDISHLDETTFSTPNVPANFMMKPTRDYGPQEARGWSGVEVGILTDLGYTVVPEPTTAIFLVTACITLGSFRRRRSGRL